VLSCRSSGLPGVLRAEVNNVWDDSWRGSFAMWLYLTVKPSHVEVNVDRLAYLLHGSMVRSCQTRGPGLLPGAVLSCRYSGHMREASERLEEKHVVNPHS
jgi:hypothetical protein